MAKKKKLTHEIKSQMVTMAANSFGLVAALAWNELIKETVETYIKPLVGESSGMVSLLIYSIIVTLLAVIATYNLSRIIND